MLSANVRIIQKPKPEALQVPVDRYNNYQISSLQEAVTEKYGIPGEHMKFREDSDFVYLSTASTVHYSVPIILEVDQHFDVKKSSEKETKDFIEDMTKLMEDPDTADFILKTGGKSFHVHKAVLGARSRIFRTMFLSRMKEADLGEAIITDVSEETLQEVLHFIYTGNLSGKDYGIYSLCYAAHKYHLDTLMDQICGEIKKAELKAEEVAEAFISSEMFGKEDFFNVGIDKLRRKKEMMDDTKFEEALKKYPNLLYKTLKKMSTSE